MPSAPQSRALRSTCRRSYSASAIFLQCQVDFLQSRFDAIQFDVDVLGLRLARESTYQACQHRHERINYLSNLSVTTGCHAPRFSTAILRSMRQEFNRAKV